MKISNETKVGTLTIIAIVILILGFNFLKGKDILKKRKKIYAVFTDLGSLSKSNEVKINGYVIGSVTEIRAKDKDLTGLVATINLTQDVHIPRDSKAIISTPLVGGSFIIIEKGIDAVFLKSGDTLTTRMDSSILDDVKAAFAPTLSKVRVTLDTLNTVFTRINGFLNAQAKMDLQQTMANLNRASAALNGLMDNQTGTLAKSLRNIEEISTSLKSNTDDIKATIGNAKKASEKFAAIDLQPSIDAFNNLITQFKSILTKMENKDGTLGALMNDKTLYNNLNNAVLALEILMDDLRTHPKRYVNLSIFGRKDKGGSLTSPLPKDTIKK